jgi:two-component system sensor histidine kinase AlgZ
MHPMIADRGRLGPYLLCWIPLTAALAGLLVLGADLSWLEATALSIPLGVVYAFLCLSSWYLCRVRPLGPARLFPTAVTFLVASAVAASLWVAWATTVASMLALVPALAGLPDRLARATPVILILGTLLYLLVVALHYVVIALEAARENERREADLKGLAREAELRALKDQLNPHFLFNSLNSISALTSSDPARAREMCVLLSDFLRLTLGLSEKPSIALKDEVALLRNYLAIERVRFGGRLVVEEDVDALAGDCFVPPLLLQPLLENAVKHGVASRLQGSSIRLSARRTGETLVLAVENPFEEEGAARGTGLGLPNVRRRLAARWGDRAVLTAGRAEGLFRVEITIPAETV